MTQVIRSLWVVIRSLVLFVLTVFAGSALGLARAPGSSRATVAGPRQVVFDAPPPPVEVAAFPGELDDVTLTTTRSRAWLLAEGPLRAPGNAPLVTLTFDDGPEPDTTSAVLRLLEKHHVRATFFFIGRYLDGDHHRAVASRAAARDILAAGHLVGSHTHDHELLTTLSHTRVLDQIDEGIASIEHATGLRPTLFRPPYGQLDAFGEQAIAERRLGLVLWSVEAADMEDSDEDAIFAHLIGQLDFASGGLVLLHDVKWPTVRVLGRLLDWLDAHRFAVVDLPTYLRATADRPQPFASRKALEEARQARWRRAHEPVGSSQKWASLPVVTPSLMSTGQ